MYIQTVSTTNIVASDNTAINISRMLKGHCLSRDISMLVNFNDANIYSSCHLHGRLHPPYGFNIFHAS